jgi:uncharacterized protein (TIRG00374 family)
MSAAVEVSVVLPAYNEAETLADTVDRTLETLESALPAGSFEVIVAEDGCTDRTPEIAEGLAEDDDRVRHVHSAKRLGRGRALERAFEAARGETLAYLDTDLATDMAHLPELIESVRSGEYDVATGSRWLPESDADRPAKRGVPSAVYNWLARTVLRSSLQDHQCGFKAFDRDALFALIDDVEDEHWFWDTEILVRAQRAGYRIREFPVAWTPMGDTKVDLVRDVFGMGSALVRTFWQLSVSPRIDRRVSLAAGIGLTVLALGLMTLYLDPNAVLDALGRADGGLVAVAAVVYALSWPLRGLRYRDILDQLGFHERLDVLTGAIFISQTGNLVFPARAGDAVRAYVLKVRRGIPYPTGFASLAAERVFDLLTITTISGAVLATLVATGGDGALAAAVSGDVPGVNPDAARTAVVVAAAVGLLALVATVAIVWSARADRSLIRSVVSRTSDDAYVESLVGVLEGFVGGVQTVTGDGAAFRRVGALSLVIWTIDVATAAVVLAAFPGVLETISPAHFLAVCFFAVSVGNLAKVLPLSPGGIGLYEAAFTAFVVILTPVAPAVAFAASIVDHAVKNAVTIVGGVASLGALNVSLTRAVDEGSRAASQTPAGEEAETTTEAVMDGAETATDESANG